jgi:hypothetical protein
VAEVIRLQIVYETQAAAAQLQALTARMAALEGVTIKTQRATAVGATGLRTMALAGTRLATGLAAGNLSALGLANTIGRLAGPTALGAVVIATINVIHAFQEFQRITKDVTDTINNMQTAARDAQRDVARLLGEAPDESKAEKAIKRLQAAAAELRKEATRLGGPAGKLLEQQAAQLEAQIPTVGRRAAAGKRREEAAAVTKATEEYNKALQDQAIIAALLGTGPMQVLNDALVLQRKRFEDLIAKGMDPTSERAVVMAEALKFGAEQMERLELAQREQQRLVDHFTDGMQTMQAAVEEFLVTGKFAINELINEFLRIAFRAATDQFVDQAVAKVFDTVSHSASAKRMLK